MFSISWTFLLPTSDQISNKTNPTYQIADPTWFIHSHSNTEHTRTRIKRSSLFSIRNINKYDREIKKHYRANAHTKTNNNRQKHNLARFIFTKIDLYTRRPPIFNTNHNENHRRASLEISAANLEWTNGRLSFLIVVYVKTRCWRRLCDILW